MQSVQEIQRAIRELSPQEQQELCGWIDDHYPQPIDARINSALQSGHFDDRIQRALANQNAGSSRSL